MARRNDPVEQISDAFDELTGNKEDSFGACDVLCELFTRLDVDGKREAMRRMMYHARMNGLIDDQRKRRSDAGKPRAAEPETLQLREPEQPAVEQQVAELLRERSGDGE